MVKRAPAMNMEQLLICLSLALIAGLLMSRLAKAAHLPAVTSYLVAGLLLGPFFLGRLGLSGWGIGFGSLTQVESYGLITQVALGFIAFVIGNEFRLTTLESMGRQAITVGILQAVVTTALVDLALVVLHLLRPDVISMASAITLGAIAAATAPAATLMVVKQYKANGPLTHLLLMVVAIDDAVGLVLFSASFGVANALEQGRIDSRRHRGAAGGDRPLAGSGCAGRFCAQPAGDLLPLPLQAHEPFGGFRSADGRPLHGHLPDRAGALRLLAAAGLHDDRHRLLQHLPHVR